MNRDDLILACLPVVTILVKKYNNYKKDEDLQSEGMIAVIECVDRCLKENMTDENQIMARCNVWARNRILTEIYKEKIKYVDDEDVFDYAEAPEENDEELINDVKKLLTPKQLDVFELLLAGKDQDYIMETLGIERAMYFRHLQHIKQKIKQ
jgi:RNA polymerase sigma factor (sigma-70 family)